MLRSVWSKSVRDNARAIIGWAIGLLLLVLIDLGVYPSIRDQTAAELNRVVEGYPEAFKAVFGIGGGIDLTSAKGFLGAELFAFMLPLLLIIQTIASGARAIAGEEEARTLDLLLARPFTRRRLVLEKFATLVCAVALVGFVTFVALAIGDAVLGMGLGAGRLGEAVVLVVLVAVDFGTLALAIGCLTGRRTWSAAIAGVAAVATFLIQSLAALVGTFDAIDWLSPFFYYGQPLVDGLRPLSALVLIGTAALFLAGAIIAFDRRDVTA